MGVFKTCVETLCKIMHCAALVLFLLISFGCVFTRRIVLRNFFLMKFNIGTSCSNFARAIFSVVFLTAVAFSITLNTPVEAKAGTYKLAKSYMGLHERKHTGRLKKAIGVNPRSTPWCGAFAATVVKRAGKKAPGGHLRAVSWKRAGKGVSLKNAKKGDIVVIRTKRGHHVGFYAGRSKGRVQVLGGNQSNRVQISNYRIGSVASIRRL